MVKYIEQDEEKELKMNKLKNDIYHWMIMNLPIRLMYKFTSIDNQHKMWLPRWGWSKKQLLDAEKKVKQKYSNILKNERL